MFRKILLEDGAEAGFVPELVGVRVFVQTNSGNPLPGFGDSAQGPIIGGYFLIRIEKRPLQTTERAATPDTGEVRAECSTPIRDGVALPAALGFEDALSAGGVAFGSLGGLADAQRPDMGHDLPHFAAAAGVRGHGGFGAALGDEFEQRFVL